MQRQTSSASRLFLTNSFKSCNKSGIYENGRTSKASSSSLKSISIVNRWKAIDEFKLLVNNDRFSEDDFDSHHL